MKYILTILVLLVSINCFGQAFQKSGWTTNFPNKMVLTPAGTIVSTNAASVNPSLTWWTINADSHDDGSDNVVQTNWLFRTTSKNTTTGNMENVGGIMYGNTATISQSPYAAGNDTFGWVFLGLDDTGFESTAYPLMVLNGYGVIYFPSSGQITFSPGGDAHFDSNKFFTDGAGNLNAVSLTLTNNLTALGQINGNGVGITNISGKNISAIYSTTPVAVTVGASPFTFTNKTPVRINCYFSGTVAYSISLNGAAVYGSLAGDAYFILPPTNSCVITYSVAPTLFTNAW